MPIDKIPAGKETDVRPVELNAPMPIVVRVAGNAISVNVMQESKADAPMLVTESGITTDVRNSQELNAYSPIVVIPEGIVTEVIADPAKADAPIVRIAMEPFVLGRVMVNAEPVYPVIELPSN